MSRGDETGLDTLADRGLQSVRALGPNRPRTLLMLAVDEPPAGPHLYRARAALTTEESGHLVTEVTQSWASKSF